MTGSALIATLAAAAMLLWFLAESATTALLQDSRRAFIEILVLSAALAFLLYGNLLYQCCRLGYYRRKRAHVPTPRDLLEALHSHRAPSLAVLIPSYKEEPEVVRQTMISAALTEYPDKSVTLLIDDPPAPGSEEDRLRLEATRKLPVELNQKFGTENDRCLREWRAFRERCDPDSLPDVRGEARCLAAAYRRASRWLDRLAAEFVGGQERSSLTHTDAFFIEEILKAQARQHDATASEIEHRYAEGDRFDWSFFERHYSRLTGLFNVRFSSFERKRYDNVSREANKAMNLNTYIGLMGRRWFDVEQNGARLLVESFDDRADFSVPAADYLITLDADSMLKADYALRLVHEMERPENARVGVIQTPYSAFPNSPNELERIAGATTDLQYIVHQGFTNWNATFWVGANALLRRAALDDIKHVRTERGWQIPVYIQDRTVIEDTESSIDLIAKGWSLVNYPERLAYSATPPDFGALLIQRRRWSNGGLIILPQLFRYARTAPKTGRLVKELFMRFHYLASLAGGTAAMALTFFYPFGDALASVWIPLSVLPYYVLYARDLRACGYRHRDLLRVYSLNLALAPVVADGVARSIRQGVTGVKVPFGRTPKVATRSATPASHAFVQLVLPLLFIAIGVWDLREHRWSHAAFSLANGALMSYAIARMLGLRALVQDLFSSGGETSSAHADRNVRPVASPAAVDESETIASAG